MIANSQWGEDGCRRRTMKALSQPLRVAAQYARRGEVKREKIKKMVSLPPLLQEGHLCLTHEVTAATNWTLYLRPVHQGSVYTAGTVALAVPSKIVTNRYRNPLVQQRTHLEDSIAHVYTRGGAPAGSDSWSSPLISAASQPPRRVPRAPSAC